MFENLRLAASSAVREIFGNGTKEPITLNRGQFFGAIAELLGCGAGLAAGNAGRRLFPLFFNSFERGYLKQQEGYPLEDIFVYLLNHRSDDGSQSEFIIASCSDNLLVLVKRTNEFTAFLQRREQNGWMDNGAGLFFEDWFDENAANYQRYENWFNNLTLEQRQKFNIEPEARASDYAVYNFLPEGQRPIFINNRTAQEVKEELERITYSEADLRQDWQRFLPLKQALEAVKNSSDLARQPQLVADYLDALRRYLLSNLYPIPEDFFPQEGFLDREEIFNPLLKQVPQNGDCAEVSVALELFTYWQLRELFDIKSLYVLCQTTEQPQDGGFFAHAVSLFTLKGTSLTFIMDNGYLVNGAEEQTPGKIGIVYDSEESAFRALFAAQRPDMRKVFLIRPYYFPHPQSSLLKPILTREKKEISRLIDDIDLYGEERIFFADEEAQNFYQEEINQKRTGFCCLGAAVAVVAGLYILSGHRSRN